MEAVEGFSIKRLVKECRGKSRLIEFYHPQLLHLPNLKDEQDVHHLPCIIRDCPKLCAYIHPICHYHARQNFYVDFKESTIPHAGRGVFIYKSVRKKTHLMNCTGLYRNYDEIMADYEAVATKPSYMLTVDTTFGVDYRSTLTGLGRGINHSPDPERVNVMFCYDEANCLFSIFATKDILVPAGGCTELFVDYGDSYWIDTEPNYPPPVEWSDKWEEFVEPEDWPVTPSYESVKFNPDIEICPKFQFEKLLSMCKNNRLLLPLPNKKFLDTFEMRLTKSNTVVYGECIVENCDKLCSNAHPLCSLHLNKFGFAIGISTIPKAGLGVFVLKSVPADCVLMSFTGCYCDKDDIYEAYNKAKSQYFYVFETVQNMCIDARSSVGGMGRLINHNPNPDEVNVELMASPETESFYIRSRREILVPKGGQTELFLDYGTRYWEPVSRFSGHPQHSQRSQSVHQLFEPIEPNYPCVPAYQSNSFV